MCHWAVVYQWGMTTVPVNPSILPNLDNATMWWLGVPSFFGNPHVHFPNLDPNVSVFGMIIVYSLSLVDFLLTVAVWWLLFSAKLTLKSCTLTFWNASSINSIPFWVNICAWFHARVHAFSYLVLFSLVRSVQRWEFSQLSCVKCLHLPYS